MKTLIATATKYNQKQYETVSKLHQSLRLHSSYYDCIPTYENKDGLCKVYNRYLEQYSDDYECIIFVHDDVFIDSVSFVDTIKLLFANNYSVVGLAGGSNLKIKKPCLWHLLTNKNTQSGIVSHYLREFNSPGAYVPTIFGQTPKPVVLLDGLFLALNTKDIKKHNIKFDENIAGFHHYDLKFSIDCYLKGLKLTTAPIHVIHESPGLTNMTKEYITSEEYLYKFLESHGNRK